MFEGDTDEGAVPDDPTTGLDGATEPIPLPDEIEDVPEAIEEDDTDELEETITGAELD